MKRFYLNLTAAFLVLAMGLGLTACDKTPKQNDGIELGFGLEENFEETAELDENPDKSIPRATEPIRQNVITKLDGTCLSGDAYLYRSLLSDRYKQAYDLIRAGIVEGKAEIPMTVAVSKDDIRLIYRSVFYDSPDLFWMEGGYKFSYNNAGNITKVKPKYNGFASDIPGNREKLEKAVSEALADMWSLPDSTAQVKYAHDYLTHSVTYDANSADNQTAFSAIVNKESVCAGYSRAFQYMMQKMGIRCGYISGFGTNSLGNGAHAWNIVEIDGEFYAMDVTWDDPIGSAADKYYYNYFNLSDAKFASDHTRGEYSVSLPEAKGTAKDYKTAFGGNQYGTDFDSIKGTLPEGYGKASTAFLGDDADDAKTADNPYIS